MQIEDAHVIVFEDEQDYLAFQKLFPSKEAAERKIKRLKPHLHCNGKVVCYVAINLLSYIQKRNLHAVQNFAVRELHDY